MSTHELLEEREFLLKSLADLEAERAAGDIDDADYRALKDDYTARAATVLRALERGAASPVVTAPPPRRRVRAVVGAGLVVLVAAAAGFGLANSAGERLPDDQATGSLTLGPSDRIRRAQQLASKGDALAAIKLYDEILKEDPDNAVALTQRGWLVSRAGLVDEGLASIDRGIAADPTYPDAHFFRGFILMREKDQPGEAAAAYRRFLALGPPPELVKLVEEELRRALAEAEARGIPVPPA